MRIIVSLTCFWFVFLSVLVVSYPKWVGALQAQMELGFYEEAGRIGLWGE